MTASAALTALAALGVGVAGCSEDPTDVSVETLYGLWGAHSMVYTSDADPETEVDVVGSAEGGTYSIQFFADGQYQSQLSSPTTGLEVVTGEFDVEGRRLILRRPETGQARTLEISFSNALMTLTEEDAFWDFDGDGTEEAARLELVLDHF